MRASVVIGVIALAASGVAVWYFGTNTLPPPARRGASFTTNPSDLPQRKPPGEAAPKDLTELAKWLKDVPLTQRDQFLREILAGLSVANPADRAKIRAFLLSGADAEIVHPDQANHPLSAEFTTTLRLYLLAMLEDFPAAEAVPLARELLAKNPDFRASLLCLRALERHQPEANRQEALLTMTRVLPAASTPAPIGAPTERYLADFDRIVEPIAHYKLTELHKPAMQMVKANPIMAGRYSEAIMAFPPAARDAAITDVFTEPAVAMELLGASGTRSADLWTVPQFRAQTAGFFANKMNDSQRTSLITELAEPTGMAYPQKPLVQSKKPELIPVDPKAEMDNAKARQAMIDALAPLAVTPALKEEVDRTKKAIDEEIKTVSEMESTRPQPLKIPESVLRGEPASAAEQQTQPSPQN